MIKNRTIYTEEYYKYSTSANPPLPTLIQRTGSHPRHHLLSTVLAGRGDHADTTRSVVAVHLHHKPTSTAYYPPRTVTFFTSQILLIARGGSDMEETHSEARLELTRMMTLGKALPLL